MDQPMTQEESYANRRKLFKDIWESAMGEVTKKPKVIKTLRLDEVDHLAGKRKKQKIRNLRTVCNKLLDFCDLQEAEDIYFKQVAIQNKGSMESNLTDSKKTKVKTKKKKRAGNAKCVIPSTTITDAIVENVTVEKDETLSRFIDKISRSVSPIKIRQTSNNQTYEKKKQFKNKGSKRKTMFKKGNPE